MDRSGVFVGLGVELGGGLLCRVACSVCFFWFVFVLLCLFVCLCWFRCVLLRFALFPFVFLWLDLFLCVCLLSLICLF